MTATVPGTREAVARLVVEVVTEILPTVPATDVVGHRHLKDLGADSVDRVEIIVSLLDRLALDEPLSLFADLPNLDAMVDLLHERRTR
jgi:polyketide biosynthesis acyl carrier protein